MQITRFRVEGLFGTQNIDLPISDNKLVIVGVNGTGKSTVINIFYYFVSRRWTKLVEMPFVSLSLEINGEHLYLSRDEIRGALRYRGEFDRLFRHYMPSSARPFDDAFFNWFTSTRSTNDPEFEISLARNLAIPTSQLKRVLSIFNERTQDERLRLEPTPNFSSVSQILQQQIVARVLFLPTYRRIEKDLKAIVPDIEQRVRSFEEKFGEPGQANSHKRTYIDLVEFGMDDVKHLINRTLSELNQFARQQLNELTGEYLGEVIRGIADDFDLKDIAEFNDEEISSVLDRFDERTLTQFDKSNLQNLLKGFHDDPQSRAPKDRYIAHFFAKLGAIARRLQEKEISIRKFVHICNDNYLVGKRFVYDRKQFALQVVLSDGMTVDLKDLSSGEKQIISLFAHICLSPSERFIVIIDEPELSLSVDWQENLLPDILKTGRCEFIAAVTHSPFIYDNQFDQHTIDLLEHSKFPSAS